MDIHADVLIRADGTLQRDVVISVIDGKVDGILPSTGKNAFASYAVITPMFHNGHSHCEYQALESVFPSSAFFPWIRDVVRLKQRLPSMFWLYSTLLGVTKLLQMGYASTGDCSESGFAAAIMAAHELNGVCYREVNGLSLEFDGPRCQSIVNSVLKSDTVTTMGIAPHAIYSTCQNILENVAKQSQNVPVCIHVDESPEEERFCRFADGPFVEMYERRGIVHRSPHSSALQYFDAMGLVTSKTLLVHGCTWDADDIAIVKAKDACVAICPESNHYLQCGYPPVELFYDQDVRTVIGTDSALSCRSMSAMHQMKLLMSNNPNVDFHRWIYQSQVTPMAGNAYDVTVGSSADFCAFGKGMTVEPGELIRVIEQIADFSPEVYRTGKLMDYKVYSSLHRELVSIVKELSAH
jgi:cytosine/adenosine deaminase-related metal-dependent hydrolase